MTKTYHDIEAVTRLLEEKEKDLELAAKIGQELLERNRALDERVGHLESQLCQSNEALTQIRHELQVKTDILRVYTNDDSVDESSPLEVKNVNIDLLQRKIQDLEAENKKLQADATELAKEAFEVEEKEEKLVSDAVKHLTEANVQISFLSEEFTHKSDESRKQKEEITHLLAQVCDLQAKTKHFTRENHELQSSLIVYKETQNELTEELSDLKEKYREVVDLLHDTQSDLRKAKKGYSGYGRHSVSGMFGSSAPTFSNNESEFSSLQTEIHSSLRPPKKKKIFHVSKFDSNSEFSDSDHDPSSRPQSSRAQAFSKTFQTFRTATSGPQGCFGDSPFLPPTHGYAPGLGSSNKDQDFDLAHESVGSLESEFQGGALEEDKGHPGIGSIPNLGSLPPFGGAESQNAMKVPTIGELKVPDIQQNALSSALGSVPSLFSHNSTNTVGNDLGSILDDSEVLSLTKLGKRDDFGNVADGMEESGVLNEFSSGNNDFQGGALDDPKGKISSDLETTLQNLTPDELERRRQQMGMSYGYDLGSDGFDSPGSLIGKPGFHFLPYGVRTPDSIMSTGSRFFSGSQLTGSSGYGSGWKLPDKLRIVKPLEGSLTLHHWQRLAVPHLGNILEERSGIATKGTPELMREELSISDLNQETDYEDFPVKIQPQEETRTNQTITDSKVLHPEDNSMTILTSSFNQVQLSSGFGDNSSRCSSAVPPSDILSSQFSSRRSSCSSFSALRRTGTLTFSSNIGLAQVLNERHIQGGLTSSTLSLNTQRSLDGDSSICSLTPSAISSPTYSKSFSPTGTPLNSPFHTPPGTPPNEKSESGIVQGFFSSLRSALYGEQQKEIRQSKRKKKNKQIGLRHLGILEKVEEVGVENLMSNSPVPPFGISSRGTSLSRESSTHDIPGLGKKLGYSPTPDFSDVGIGGSNDATIGQLSAPTFSMYGRPSLNPGDLGKVPSTAFGDPGYQHIGEGAMVGGRGPGRVISCPGEKRPQLLGALGVPGTPGTGALKRQPPQNVRLRQDLGSVPVNQSPEAESHGFIGNITEMFFGRKGGLSS